MFSRCDPNDAAKCLINAKKLNFHTPNGPFCQMSSCRKQRDKKGKQRTARWPSVKVVKTCQHLWYFWGGWLRPGLFYRLFGCSVERWGFEELMDRVGRRQPQGAKLPSTVCLVWARISPMNVFAPEKPSVSAGRDQVLLGSRRQWSGLCGHLSFTRLGDKGWTALLNGWTEDDQQRFFVCVLFSWKCQKHDVIWCAPPSCQPLCDWKQHSSERWVRPCASLYGTGCPRAWGNLPLHVGGLGWEQPGRRWAWEIGRNSMKTTVLLVTWEVQFSRCFSCVVLGQRFKGSMFLVSAQSDTF